MKPTWRDYLDYYWFRFYRRFTRKGRKEQEYIDQAIEKLFGKEN